MMSLKKLRKSKKNYLFYGYFLEEEKNKENYDEILSNYFELNNFLKISEFFDESFVNLFTSYKNDYIEHSLKCLDTVEIFKNLSIRAVSCVFFSATLSPIKFYAELFGGDNNYKIHLNSPFEAKNLFLANMASISTKYSQREYSYEPIAETIHEVIKSKSGNYIAYFPSYRYMEEVVRIYSEKYKNDNILVQDKLMNENERLKFLEKFTGSSSILGFAVLGGVFLKE